MTTVQTLDVVIRADTSALKNGLNDANNSGNTLQQTFRRVGGAIAGYLTINAIKDFGEAAIGTAIEFESAFANVRKTVEGTDEELATLQQTLRDMATDSTNPLSALDNAAVTLMNIAALGGQLGVSTDNLDEFAQTVGALTVATDMSAESAATFIARYANVAGLDVSQYSAFADVLVTLGNNMAANESQIAGFANSLATLATYDWSHEDIMAYSAAMASLGLGTEAGSTALRRINSTLIEIANSPADLAAFADSLGLMSDEFADLVTNDPAQAMSDFLQAYNELSTADRINFRDEFGLGDVRITETLDKLSSGYDVLAEATELSTEAFEGNNAAMDEAAAKADTTQGRINQFNNAIAELQASIGEQLLPILNDIIPRVTEFINTLDVGGMVQSWRNNFEMLGRIVNIMLDRISRGWDVFMHDTRLRFIEFVNGFRQLVLDATGGNVDIAPDINFAYTDEQSNLAAMDAVDQFTNAIKDQISQGGIDLSDIMIQNGDFSQLAIDSVTLDPQSLSFDPETFGAEARYAIQDALRLAYEEGNLQDVETLTALALALEIDTNIVEEDMQAILGAQEFFAEVVTNLRVRVNTVDTSNVVGAVGAAAAAAGSFLGNMLPQFAGGGMFNAPAGQSSGLALLHDGEQILTPAQQRAGAGGGRTNVFNVTAVGMSPRQVLEMLRREADSQGF